MVLTFTPGTTRLTIALSKFLAYLTRCLFINFAVFVLPFLFNFSNWTNHLGSVIQLLLGGGLFFPVLFFGFSSLFFWWLEINGWIGALYTIYAYILWAFQANNRLHHLSGGK